MQKHRVLMYIRYIDNLLFISDSDLATVREGLLTELNTKLHPYSGKLEELSDQSVVFLDVVWFRGPRFAKTRCLDSRANLKAKGRLLKIESCHPPFCICHGPWLI